MTDALRLNRRFVNQAFARVTAVWNQLEESGQLVNETFDLTPDQLATLLREALWASLGRDEGRSTSFTLVVGREVSAGGGCVFETRRPFTARELAKLAPAVTRGELLIGVGHFPEDRGREKLRIWGLSSSLWSSLNLITVGPGRIVLRVMWTPAVAVSRERGILLKDVWSDAFPPPTEEGKRASHGDTITASTRNMALSLMVSAIREAGHGGTLLVASSPEHLLKGRLNSTGAADLWDAIVDRPFLYFTREGSLGMLPGAMRQLQRQTRVFDELESEMPRETRDGQVTILVQGDLGEKHSNAWNELKSSQSELIRAARTCAKTAEVDGAVILDRDLGVLAFGVKLIPSVRGDKVKCVHRNPVEGVRDKTVKGVADLGGTRHQSAARFLYERPGWYGYVVSQDGGVTVLHRDRDGDRVIALRDSELLFP